MVCSWSTFCFFSPVSFSTPQSSCTLLVPHTRQTCVILPALRWQWETRLEGTSWHSADGSYGQLLCKRKLSIISLSDLSCRLRSDFPCASSAMILFLLLPRSWWEVQGIFGPFSPSNDSSPQRSVTGVIGHYNYRHHLDHFLSFFIHYAFSQAIRLVFRWENLVRKLFSHISPRTRKIEFSVHRFKILKIQNIGNVVLYNLYF